jgi:hypothetical protein
MPVIGGAPMNREDVDTFEKLTAQLGSTHSEISILSRIVA